MPVIQIDATGMAPRGTDLNPSSWKLDFTLNLGVSLNYTLWGFRETISRGLVTDSHRNVGTYFSYGGGTGQGADFSGGIQGGVSNGRSIRAVGGPSPTSVEQQVWMGQQEPSIILKVQVMPRMV
jgi:hypothetical protein